MKQIELYDVGRTTHRAVKGMYQFIAANADRYIKDKVLAERLKEEAKNRELNNHSIPQEYFTLITNIVAEAYRAGHFPIDLQATVYPDTISRFEKVQSNGRRIGVLTSGSHDFTKIMFDVPGLNSKVNEYLFGEEIGDKDHPETFVRLWNKSKDGIYAIFDDKPSVCKAASDGMRQVNAHAKIFLVDRNGGLPVETLEELAAKGIIRISSFDEVKD